MKGHLRKRGKSSWAIVVDLGRDANGKRRQKWTSVKGTRRDAERELTKVLRELDTGTYVEPSNLSVREYLDLWLNDYAKAQVGAKTFERYKQLIDSHIVPTLGGHKFHGPLGAAALWVRRGNNLDPLLVGGAQERRRRAGTENVPALVGLGTACRLARTELDHRRRHLARLRDRFETGLLGLDETRIHCRSSPRLPNTTNVAFSGVDAQALLIRMDLAGFAISTGSACASGSVEPSTTLLALGLSVEEALSSLRISFGMPNAPNEVDALLAQLSLELDAMRAAKRVLATEP